MFTDKEKEVCIVLTQILYVFSGLCVVYFFIDSKYFIYKLIILLYASLTSIRLTKDILNDKKNLDRYYYRRIVNDGSIISKISIFGLYCFYLFFTLGVYFVYEHKS